MPELYPYKKLASYPHMKPADVAIWEKFITLYPEAYDNVLYDLPVNKAGSVVPHPDPAVQEDWAVLKSYKIDVVGFKAGRTDVIEVKPHAGLGAIGQAACYLEMYHEYHDADAGATPVILTDTEQNDMKWLCARFNIRLVIV